MGTSGAESLNVAASLFLGQTEAPLTIRPYLPRLTNSELLTVMTAGMAHVSGGVMAAYFAFGVEPRHILTAVIMTAPGAILLSKMLVPETGKPETLGQVRADETRPDANLLDAAARGTRDGLFLALNIAAMLIAFLGLIALVNKGLGFAGTSLETLFGQALAPVAYLLGVPWSDCRAVGGLLGTRTVLNELIAFGQLGDLKDELDPAIVHDRDVRPLRVRQFQLDRHPARRDRRTRPRPPRRPGAAGLPGPARGDPGQLSLGLHRGDPAVNRLDLFDRANEAAVAILRSGRRSARRSP